jgi:DNA-directed RNA polymerase specialized sigma24 family protein
MQGKSIDIVNGIIDPQIRTRIIRLCATITGNAEIAEDLAQETLLEAWRHLHNLQVEVDGHTAAVTRIESVIDSAWLDVVLSLDTYKILQVHGEHGEQA